MFVDDAYCRQNQFGKEFASLWPGVMVAHADRAPLGGDLVLRTSRVAIVVPLAPIGATTLLKSWEWESNDNSLARLYLWDCVFWDGFRRIAK